MKRLKDAEAGVASLTKDLVAQQESLMKEGDDQKTSLLLGVLMTRQKDTMEEQLKVLKSEDFSGLTVVKALLAKHDEKVPLFKQVADLLDKSGHRSGAQNRVLLPYCALRAENGIETHSEGVAGFGVRPSCQLLCWTGWR